MAKPDRASTDKLKAINARPECDRPRGSYIYLLEDSRTGVAFYVGKGKGLRYRAHIKEARAGFGHNPPKLNRIRQIEAAGAKVIHRLVKDGLSEEAAFDLKVETIKEIGQKNLTNILPGRLSDQEWAQAFKEGYAYRYS